MCGLLFTNRSDISEEAFRRALDLMAHRGPDAVGCITSAQGCLLGHNRLKIQDLENRSNQPFASADGRYLMLYNGEVYNFKELAAAHRITPRTSSDTEILLELYLRRGPRMLDELNGMFAIVILDAVTGEVFAARDRLGIKPLYLARSGETLTFSSEVAPLLELGADATLDDVGVRQYRKLRTFFNGRTLYRGVSMFPAGHYLLGGRLHRFWELPRGPQSAPDDDEIRELFESAVAYRRISDVEVGSYLSGGVDSTIVAGLSSKPHTWTVGTADNNEFEWARLAADKFGSIHHEVLLREDEFVDLARDLITVRREPLSVPNEVLLYRMTQEVKRYNTVILSGEGADELFFGYDRIFRWAHEAPRFDLRAFDEHYSYGTHRDDEVLEDALAPFMDRGSALDIVAAFFQVAHLHGLLRRVDNSTMRCSVEARVPFVDHRLVERMAGVPFDHRMAKGVVKAPLKRIFSDLLPPAIVDRPKVGFPVDLAAVLAVHTADGESQMDRWLDFNLQELGLDG